MENDWLHRSGLHRVRILWMMLIALLLVSLLPIWFYHRRVLDLSETELLFNEKVQQAQVTRSLAEEVHLYESSIHQQLTGLHEVFRLSGMIRNVNDTARAPQVNALLENFVQNNPNILYVTAIGTNAKGQEASNGQFRADQDPFVRGALQRAFVSSMQRVEFHSDPLSQGDRSQPAFIVARPLFVGEDFRGMIAAVVSLAHVMPRLNDLSTSDREVYVVDKNGRVVAHPNSQKVVAGTDLSGAVEIVAKYKVLEARVQTTETHSYTVQEAGQPVEMTGTYSTVPELNWAVVAQRKLKDMRAGVDLLNQQARTYMAVVLVVALVFGWFFALGITEPISGLAESTRAISRGEFHERAPVRGAAEISELADTFNKMAGNIETYIEQLKEAAEENRELFIGSIRMLAAAIDEKDPYTRGHSGRVAKYSVIIAEELGLDAEELDRLRISALLHDVGKIGVDDRVLKKPGSLTPEEFELMKQHPVKGANIMRPVAQLKEMLPGIELHHEHVDGRGYPYGLAGDQIPMMARIIAVADTLDAMTTNRPYQSAKEITFALERIRQLGGTKFDDDVVKALDAAVASGRLKLSATLVEV